MIALITGSLVLSILHALIPSHWLPVLAVSRKEKWSLAQTTYVTFLAGLAHALSTVLIGVVLGLVGVQLASNVQSFTHYFAPALLVVLGLFYIYQHHRHHHFHIHPKPEQSKNSVIIGLVVAMFFSPCFEIEAYFLMAGTHGWTMITLLSILYTTVTVGGMVIWVRLTYKGFLKLNWHSLEHNAGIITGATLIITGIISFFIH